MRPVLTPEQMAEADARTVALGTPHETLILRAGRAAAWEMRRALGGTYGRRVVVVRGKGNNGADGLVAARALRAWGARVDVFQIDSSVDSDTVFDPPAFARSLARADGVIDAMYGTGLRGAISGLALDAVHAINACVATVVSVDIPSGVDGATGTVASSAVHADRTVTFAAEKPGHCLGAGRSCSGVVTVVDVGVDLADVSLGLSTGITERADVLAWLPQRPIDAHKWSVGALMVIGGQTGMTGAPMLASRAAMRAGVGIVWCGVPGTDAASRASGSEVITFALDATGSGSMSATAFELVLDYVKRFDALVLGPGLGTAAGTAEAVVRIIADVQTNLVLDADGLNSLRGDLSALLKRPAGVVTVLTPHDGEYKRLLGVEPGKDRVAAARCLADATGAIVLLKGRTTVVAEPHAGRVALNSTGGPWLATAGTGDVLSGIIGAFLAVGAPGFEAAAAAAWVHGSAADECGHNGLIASDLLAAIPAVLRDPQDLMEA